MNLVRDLGADAWLLLFALSVGDSIEVVEGRPCAVVTDAAGAVVCRALLCPDVLDRLEDERLIEHHGGGVRPTDRGRYWVRKWAALTFKGGKRAAVLDATTRG